jgi:hypothetical protein
LPPGALANDGVPEGLKKVDKSHAQLSVVALRNAKTGGTLQDFCVNRDGLVLALISNSAAWGVPSAPAVRESMVQVLDRDGKLLRDWKVDFAGQAINAAPDGSIYLGGNGHLARYDAEGKLLAEGDAPQLAVLSNEEELIESAKEQLEAENKSYAEQIKRYEEILGDPKKLEELETQYATMVEQQLAEQQKNLTDEQKEAAKKRPQPKIDVKKMYADQLKSMKARKERTVDDMVASIRSRLNTVNAISSGGDDVFIACAMSKGYAYAVWRTDREFKNAKQIITGLSGCCGQMDIQAVDDQVYVAENSRHRIVHYNRDGKKLGAFGKTDREGVGEGFGGCCNPMNLCFASDGGLLASESCGVVKRFSRDGKYESLVGIAQVPPGCKNSAIGISSDGERVYYIDIQGSNLIVLARGSEPAGNSK